MNGANERKRMTRNGKIARLPAALHEEQNKQRIRRILGLGEGYDGSKNPELARPPALRGGPLQAITSHYKSVQVNISEYNQ
jgi:hypothetical protein